MGVGCLSKPSKNHPGVIESPALVDLDEIDWTEDNANEQVDKLLKDIQEHNLKRMKEEIETDINTFVLNNLLMCIQFFDNFERSKDSASQFKRDKESNINNKLSEPPTEGMILGERRCHLLHGMPQVLAQNYIYQPPDNFVDEEYYGSFYYGSDPRNTFMCEGILPLEFTMTWDNLEVYQNSEWDSLQAIQYSSAKGVPPILRFAMEEPDDKNNVPRGFVRLRCADVAADIYRPTKDSSYDYAYGGKFNDTASEADSEDRLSEVSGSDIDAEDFRKTVQMRATSPMASPHSNSANAIEERLGINKPKQFSQNLGESSNAVPSTSTSQKNLEDKFKNRRPSGILPVNYPLVNKPKPTLNLASINGAKSESSIPSLQINPSYTPPITDNHPPVFNYNQFQKNTLVPPVPKRTKRNGQSKSLQNLNGQSSSSGYERISNGSNTSAFSRSSSIASEDVRHKWRHVELKELWQYPARNRVKSEEDAEKQDPLSSKCFISVKHENLSSDEESDTDSDSSSDSDRVPSESLYETRHYLNSTQFSSEYCSEFHYMGLRSGLNPNTISQAVVLGTTVRSAVPYVSEEDTVDNANDFHMPYTFTPSLHSKNWPPNYYFWFNQRVLNGTNSSGLRESWPNQEQIELIEKLGVTVVPLGFRSIDFFNTQQSLEWQLNFALAETQLLNTFKNVHWRTYIFSSLIFRAFLAPLGPQGIGIEHIRNILYFMCNEDYVGWNDEQPGVHLRAILSKLYDCLAKGKMPNFFVQSQNLLKNIPSQNTRLVQAHLSHVKDNLTIYCIYAIRNLACLRREFYPVPDVKKLYSILTVPDKQGLLKIHNPILFGGMVDVEPAVPKKKKGSKRKTNIDLLEDEAMIELEFRTHHGNANKSQTKKDKTQDRLRRNHLLYEQKLREHKARLKEFEKQKASGAFPTDERKQSIDLQQLPVIQQKFSMFRKTLLIEFFIKHFIKMSKKSNEFRAYAQSAMYILQVENLCELMLDPRYDLGNSSLDITTIEEYKQECSLLRDVVGKELREYVLSRLSHRNISTLSSNHLVGELSPVRGPFQSNWDFRKLPTPPGSHADLVEWETPKPAPPKKAPHTSIKKLETPNIAKSLQSIGNSSSTKQSRHTESIRFIDKPAVIKRTASRQSIMLETTDDLSESTDL